MTRQGKRTDEEIGLIAGLAAYVAWGVFPLYFHSLEPTSAIEVVCHRILWSLLFLIVPLAIKRDWEWVAELRADRRLVGKIALAASVLCVNWVVYIWAATHGHVVEGALGYFINPLIVIVVGVGVLGERLRRLQWFAVTCGVVAVGVLTLAYGRVPWISLVLAVSFASYGFLKRQIPLTSLQSLAAETAVLAPLALVTLVALEATGHARFGTTGIRVALWLAVAGPVTAVPLLWFGVAARRLPYSTIGLLQYVTPVLQLLCGVVVLHESMPAERWIGFGIVWIGLAALVTDGVTTQRAEAAPVPVADL